MKSTIWIIIILIFLLLVTTITAWTDNSITTNTNVKKTHTNELITAIDTIRSDVGLAGYSWTDSTIVTGMIIKAAHFNELRTAIENIYSTVGLGAPSWGDTISAGGIPKTSHVEGPRSNLTSVNSTIQGYTCCGSYGGSDTGSTGSCPGSDDSACGTIDCDGRNYYYTSGSASASGTNYCKLRDYADITTNRCEGINDCKDANTADCTSYADSTVATCGLCKYASGACSSCYTYSDGTACGTGKKCSSGNIYGDCVTTTDCGSSWSERQKCYGFDVVPGAYVGTNNNAGCATMCGDAGAQCAWYYWLTGYCQCRNSGKGGDYDYFRATLCS